MFTDASSILNGYGLAGVVILALASVAVILYRDNKSLQEKLRESEQARVNDAKEVQDKIAGAQRVLAEVMDLMYRKLDTAKKDSQS